MWNRTSIRAILAVAFTWCACLAIQWQQASAQDVMAADPGPIAVPGERLAPIPDMADASAHGYAAPYDPILPADCGLGCFPSWYVQGEMLFFTKGGNGPWSMSNAIDLPEFDHELGMRITVGRRWDCAEGLEFSYAGPFEWLIAGEANGFPLDSYFFAPGGDVDISAFNQAEAHRQTYRSELHSVELNRRFWDWDTMSCLYGLRYFDVSEEFRFDSLGPLPLAEQGTFQVEAQNRLIGPQVGLDVIQPVGASNRLTLIAKTKLGLYANFAEGNAQLVNAGVQQFNNRDNKVAFAFHGELGLVANFQITRRLSVRGGYELWYLDGLTAADDPAAAPLSRTTGRGLNCKQDDWFHGATLGGLFTW